MIIQIAVKITIWREKIGASSSSLACAQGAWVGKNRMPAPIRPEIAPDAPITGIIAAVTHMIFNWGSLMPVIGASGAISGLMGAGMRLLPTQAPWAHASEEELAPIFSRQIVIFTAIWMIINLAAGLTGFGLAMGLKWARSPGKRMWAVIWPDCCWQGPSTVSGPASPLNLLKP